MRTTTKLKINALLFVLVAAFMAISSLNPGTSLSITPGGDAESIRPVAPGSPQALLAQHDCWTGEQPAGKELGAAVLTLKGAEGPVFTTAHGLLNQAIDKAVFGLDSRVGKVATVHGFCEAAR